MLALYQVMGLLFRLHEVEVHSLYREAFVVESLKAVYC